MDIFAEFAPWYSERFGPEAVRNLAQAMNRLDFSYAASLFREKTREDA